MKFIPILFIVASLIVMRAIFFSFWRLNQLQMKNLWLRHKMAKNLLAEGLSLDLVRKVTELSDLDLVELEKA